MTFCSRKSYLTCFNLVLLASTIIVLISQFASLPVQDLSSSECPPSSAQNLLLWLLLSFTNYFIFTVTAMFICREGNGGTSGLAGEEKSSGTRRSPDN